MCSFYLAYSNDAIRQIVSDEFANLPRTQKGHVFPLSWSHYLKLMRIRNIDERHFYEIEAGDDE